MRNWSLFAYISPEMKQMPDLQKLSNHGTFSLLLDGYLGFIAS